MIATSVMLSLRLRHRMTQNAVSERARERKEKREKVKGKKVKGEMRESKVVGVFVLSPPSFIEV